MKNQNVLKTLNYLVGIEQCVTVGAKCALLIAMRGSSSRVSPLETWLIFGIVTMPTTEAAFTQHMLAKVVKRVSLNLLKGVAPVSTKVQPFMSLLHSKITRTV